MKRFLIFLALLINSLEVRAECRPSDIAVVDSGVELNHPDFHGRLVQGYDFANGDNNPNDDSSAEFEPGGLFEFAGGHGTNVAGIALGLHGSSPSKVAHLSCPIKVMPLKIHSSQCSYSQWLNRDCIASAQVALRAIDHAIKSPSIRVINLSFGIGERAYAQGLIYRLEDAKNRGKFVVMAAGNNGLNLDFMIPRGKIKLCRKCPRRSTTGLSAALVRRYPNLILVANGTSKGFEDYSNFGKQTVHLGSEGENVRSTRHNLEGGGSTTDYSGTSQSAPRVSRALALLSAHYSENYLATLARLKTLLNYDNRDVRENTIFGGTLE